MNDDDLRDKLTQAAMDGLGIYATEGHRITMALMPVVREALADAWDDGYRAANDDLTDSLLDPEPDHPSTPNPWREGD